MPGCDTPPPPLSVLLQRKGKSPGPERGVGLSSVGKQSLSTRPSMPSASFSRSQRGGPTSRGSQSPSFVNASPGFGKQPLSTKRTASGHKVRRGRHQCA